MSNLDLLHDLTRRHARLEAELADLKSDLHVLKLRLNRDESSAAVPPPWPALPVEAPAPPSTPPPLPESLAPAPLIPVITPLPKIAPVPLAPQPGAETAPVDNAGLELQFGRWLARIGVVFALFTVIFFGALVKERYYHYLGPWSKVTILTLVSSALIATGLRLEKRDSKMLVYGRTLAGGGMACLYYTIYGATYVPQLRVIPSELLGGVLLLAWSAGVLVLAERRKSELLSIFAISLAYFSSAITPGNGFTMTADLILAATAVIFQLRNAWTGLSYLCLIGTYAGFVRQAVEVRGPLDFDWGGAIDFGPSAVYLTGAWLIFSSAILLSRSPDFAAGKRLAFLCLNNGAWVGLLLVAAQLGGFGHMGQILEASGFVLLAACAVAQVMQADAPDVAGAYLAQGLGLLTGGVAMVYSGVTRGLLITMESVFLVAAGAFSRKIILRIGGGVTAVLGAWYLAGELVHTPAYPWVLTFGGALAMLANAWLERVGRSRARESTEAATQSSATTPFVVSPRRPQEWIASSALYTFLALGLLAFGIFCQAPDQWAGPDLAITVLILTASIYFLPLVELPPLAQGLLILAQLRTFGLPLIADPHGLGYSDFGYLRFEIPVWSQEVVALVTMILATWWAKQPVVRRGAWLTALTVLYALAMVVFCANTFHPHATEQTWMIEAALLSLVFLAYGAWSRLWAFAISGQLLLALSVGTYLYPNEVWGFPWTWWTAAIPMAVVFGTGWIAREVLSRDVTQGGKDMLRVFARVYQSVALGMLIRWVFGVAAYPEITFLLLVLGTAFVAGNLFLRSSYGVRAGFVLSAAGVVHYLTNTGGWNNAFTWLDAGAFALLLAQPALLRRWGSGLISDEESWVLILVSSAVGWMFVSNSISAADPHHLTLGWAIFALGLTVVGFAANERRQRWCGLGILVAAFIRVAVHDFWAYPDGLKFLTFLALTVICLGLSFLYFKFGDRLKEWL